MIQVFGIPNCGSVKKARTWLEERGAAYDFVDFKKSPPSAQHITNWLHHIGRERLINRKGTSWRGLSDADKALADTDAGAQTLIAANASLIKRPLIAWPDGALTVGFDETVFAEHWKG
ncbi:MAG: Spx/MgsR family RNA polymerase-binding regulatory protein [Neisseria sp.]|nr:Spx/MgsR family RNA polymerase-binding regulatory protein [Neisseria sp.]